ncbi:hypothetical protein M0R45_009206 [Rubus argutus]|uniref:Uncharacterized protein n=1 Tax=Rubus argutus TaxID=59490 RepID=A0AAW1Y6S5_RUBAR
MGRRRNESRETPWMQMVITVEVCSADGDVGLVIWACSNEESWQMCVNRYGREEFEEDDGFVFGGEGYELFWLVVIGFRHGFMVL